MIKNLVNLIYDLFKIFLLNLFGFKIIFLDCSRIGGYYDLFWHKRSSQKKKFYFILFAPNNKIANIFFHNLIEKDFDVKYKSYNYLIYKIFQKLGLSYHPLNLVPDNIDKMKRIYANKKNKLYFYQKNLLIENYNYEYKKISFINSEYIYDKYNLKKNNYISFHSRDKNYLKNIYPDRDWSYHDYRDSDIQNYADAITKLYNKTLLKGVRIGKYVSNNLMNSECIFDYSQSNDYFDEGEISIINNSKIFLCSDTGATIFSEYINMPKVYVNWSNPLRIHRWSRDSLFIFKKIYSIEKKKYLKIEEILNINFNDHNFLKYFKLIDNSAEEIMEALHESLLRIEGKWNGTEDDIKLQNKFWNLFGDYDYSRNKTYIGSSFLRQNKDILF